MKVLVTGGRDFNDWRCVRDTLDEIVDNEPIDLIVHGGATGADSLAARWAMNTHTPQQVFKAQWATFGPAAGPVRNGQMVATKPDLVVAFPGGRGTADCVRQAKAAGLKVLEVKP